MMYTSEFLIPAEPISEDCLYLNIWTSSTSSIKKPVIVWIHGGAFVSGSGSCPIYDGEEMAGKDVVFVTINYRLGIFGFLAHPELTKESPVHASGNYAFLDQVAALQWVKKNIAAFGGDPERVTIAGQSAGSFSVNALAASPVAKGLFQRVIAESGGMFNNDGRTLTLHAAEQTGVKIMTTLKAGSIEEMRNKPADELLKAAGMGMMSPVIDGYILPTDVYSIYNQVQQNDVPVLTGWNRDEGFPSGGATSPETYKANAVSQYKELAEEFLKAYPGNTPEEIKRSQLIWSRNNFFAWHAYTWARLQTAKGKSKIFLYQFDRVPPQNEQYGAFHSAEIAYALHSLHLWNRPWTEADRKLQDIMSGYWANFAATGDPNGKGLPPWNAFDSNANSIMEFDEKETAMKPIASIAAFEFIDKYQEQSRKK
jgi:para-nitrobenzyl esterase